MSDSKWISAHIEIVQPGYVQVQVTVWNGTRALTTVSRKYACNMREIATEHARMVADALGSSIGDLLM